MQLLMQLLKWVFHRQWITLFILYFIYIPTIYAKPTATFTISPSQSGQAPLTVTLDGSKSTPSPGAMITRYDWRSTALGFMLSDSVQVKTFSVPGTYTIWLKITDNAGGVHETSKTVTVRDGSTQPPSVDPLPKPPVAHFTVSPTQGKAPLTVNLNASTSRASSTGAKIEKYQWQVNPPISTPISSQTVNTQATFTETGSYTITLMVSDSLGQNSTTKRSVIVSSSEDNPPVVSQPVSRFTILPSGGTAPLTVNLNASASQPSNGANLKSYQWSVTPAVVTSIAPQANTSVIFREAGTYTITLTVTDDLGKSSTSEQIITVSSNIIDPSFFSSSFIGEFEDALFYGGIMIRGEFLPQDALVFSDTEVQVRATIKVAPVDIGKIANIWVAVQYQPSALPLEDFRESLFYFKTQSTAFPFIAWELDPNSPFLPPNFQSDILLTEIQDIEVFTGNFKGSPGIYSVYLGYVFADGFADGRVISNYNIAAPIKFEVISRE